MRSIHILRKPCSEPTVAANVLRHGTGAVNIDATRIGFASESDEAESKTKNQHADFGSAPVIGNVVYGDYSMVPPKNYNPPSGGRWPANFILQHLPTCEHVGEKRVAGMGARVTSLGKGREGKYTNGIYGAKASKVTTAYVSEDGTETVAAWACAPGCPVAGLDAQSGVSKTPTTVTRGAGGRNGRYGPTGAQGEIPSYADTGGASRFFKQVKP